ncbi:hypothetical protein MLP_05770 [Microlunatus phosphovorus NM-1]|uniref:Uncharacterized protein n=1 Tax=Microlunatus phosphovorus (strain ATCC 700054 / DSM 10555 / JCM 9379 / NBRC 101784 / NCIMB 13414 / VKM Ac-1990 / NM-1) TaxID=1032480 RepID=F5XK95_MICPN|nr:hypothetical protein MLP_05770 [Microlunatus phosphovorus NM-1]
MVRGRKTYGLSDELSHSLLDDGYGADAAFAAAQILGTARSPDSHHGGPDTQHIG